jgi:hypothetical protein
VTDARQRDRLLWAAVAATAAALVVAVCVQLYRSANRLKAPDEPDVPPGGVTIVPDEDAPRWRRAALHDGPDQGPIRCRLVPQGELFRQRNTPDLRLELTNRGDRPVRLWYTTHPHFQVTFLVRDESGKVVSEFFWGTLSSTLVRWDADGRLSHPPPLLKLKPGETYTAGFYLSLLEEYLEVPGGPGRYRLEAVLAYTDLGGWPEPHQRYLARSAPVAVEVSAKAAGEETGWKLVP